MSIIFSHVHKTLRRKTDRTPVLVDASAEFPADQITGVLAPPGSGKTTLASLCTGKFNADKGRISRNSLVSFPVASGGIFNGLLTGRENLAFLCRVFGFDPVPIIRFIIDFAEVGKAIDKPFNSLNRDERTRIMFTAVYAIPFELYIVDGTLVGGRANFRQKCEELVAERMRTSGFLMISSSPSLLGKHCANFLVMDNMALHPAASIQDAQDRLGADRLRDGDGYAEGVEGVDNTALH
ncbi:hypothetical protein BJF92_01290 [Rhizobium rhizosphaerae]|uniref:ABC transporter domain-containing protein n=1 Tax=Xaviernesmea rhizosphaerae TaxID=1672749 RepID=A0A1Q9AEN6_9HYPH|nr:ATP-binding cassette domain-containing protein [Xaviernesmea rhizosphaerae]OLP53417.1 hypothetical protein BJF92_01290 [Xaviernesmea rhizosphaerae]OQP85339.1 hypothetical protein BTR14_15650 [Xaviernesmea rhizosphaerae]